MSTCVICLEEIKNTNNINILQSCNCIYNVHDTCIINWYNKKEECLICHNKIKIHVPYTRRTQRPPRMNFFYRLFRCCFS